MLIVILIVNKVGAFYHRCLLSCYSTAVYKRGNWSSKLLRPTPYVEKKGLSLVSQRSWQGLREWVTWASLEYMDGFWIREAIWGSSTARQEHTRQLLTRAKTTQRGCAG